MSAVAEPRLTDRVEVLGMLLSAIAAVPAGVRLSIPQLRDALVSQADVLRGIETLIAARELDRMTLRPPASVAVLKVRRLRLARHLPPIPPSMIEAEASPPSPTALSGVELAGLLIDYCAQHGLSQTRVSKHLFGGSNAISRLARVKATAKTIARVRAFLAASPPPGLHPRRAGGPRVIQNGGISGDGLADQVEALIAQHGLSKTAVGVHLYGQASGVETLRKAHRPQRHKVAQIRAFLADPPIDDLKPRDSWASRRANQRTAVPSQANRGACVQQSAAGVGSAGGGRGPAPPIAPGSSAPKRSFEEQLGRVERGEVGIGPNHKFGRPDPTQTLGGVTGEIM